MRYTKTALLVFGLGLTLGFVVVVLGGHPRLERVSSAVMALALIGLPLAIFADGHGFRLVAWIAARLRRRNRKKKPRRRSGAAPPHRRPPAKAAARAGARPRR
ncbi:MAG TPA: hypothetical protein VJR70_06970 [Stellaceae bacterium]|nr:hypothetical protein [Stellaceae bacterium]